MDKIENLIIFIPPRNSMKKLNRLKARPHDGCFSYQKSKTAFAKAVNMVGGLGAMGRILGLSRQDIWFRVNKRKRFLLDIKQCHLIEKATDGFITIKMLRSDFYGEK